MISKKKVLMVCNTDAALYKFRMPIIRRLMSDEHDVITLGGDAGYKDKLSPLVKRHYSIGSYGKESFFTVIKTVLHAISVTRKEKPEIVHGFTHYGNLIAWIVAHFLNSPIVILTITGMGRLFVDEKKSLLKSIKRFMLLKLYSVMSKKADKIIVQNETDAELLSNFIEDNKIITQPGSGVDLVNHQRKEIENNELIKVYMISRTIKEKGYIEYLYAAKKMNDLDKDKRFKFYFAGGKSLSEKWDEDVCKLANQCGVEYLGYVENVEDLLKNAHVVVLPSYYREGVPRSLLEALSYDCLILTTDMPGCRSTVIDGWNGFIFKPKSVNEICSKLFSINHLTINSSIERSSSLCEKYFNVDGIVEETIKLYHKQ